MQFYLIHFSRFFVAAAVVAAVADVAVVAVAAASVDVAVAFVVVWGCKCAIKETGYTSINLEMLATSSPSFVAIATTMLLLLQLQLLPLMLLPQMYSYSHVLMLTAFL